MCCARTISKSTPPAWGLRRAPRRWPTMCSRIFPRRPRRCVAMPYGSPRRAKRSRSLRSYRQRGSSGCWPSMSISARTVSTPGSRRCTARGSSACSMLNARDPATAPPRRLRLARECAAGGTRDAAHRRERRSPDGPAQGRGEDGIRRCPEWRLCARAVARPGRDQRGIAQRLSFACDPGRADAVRREPFLARACARRSN